MRYLPVKRAHFFCGIDGNFEEAKLIRIYFDMDLTEAVNATKKRGETIHGRQLRIGLYRICLLDSPIRELELKLLNN